MNQKSRFIIALMLGGTALFLSLVLCSNPGREQVQGEKVDPEFESRVAEYIRLYPYQQTNSLMHEYLNGDSSLVNDWCWGKDPSPIVAGQDLWERMNNDTYTKIAFIDLSKGPVTISSKKSTRKRFNTVQILDDKSATFKTILYPKGRYMLYRGDKEPKSWGAEMIKAPCDRMVVIARVEVQNHRDPRDVDQASSVFKNITVDGPRIDSIPRTELLARFEEDVAQEALRRMESLKKAGPLTSRVKQHDKLEDDSAWLDQAAVTRFAWGSALPRYMIYEIVNKDKESVTLHGSYGDYRLTTKVPPVEAFWSLTVYDSERGGHFHPNDRNRYHINGHTASYNTDGTVTVLFKRECGSSDRNCIEVPSGRFDVQARYYLPDQPLLSGEWNLPAIELIRTHEQDSTSSNR